MNEHCFYYSLKLSLIGYLLLFFQSTVHAQEAIPFSLEALKTHFVDSVYRHLSRKKRISQLFFVAAYSNRNQSFTDSIGMIIRKYQPGGIIFFQGSPKKQALIENSYQETLKVKAFIAMDGEWGLGMRLDSTLSFPYQMTLGAVRDNTLIRLMGSQIARDFKRLGMQIDFAPDVDINNNPDNTVINFRSFGDNRDNVAEKGMAFINGLQSHDVLATAKHFPGHGDTNVDSHLDLPILPFSRSRLDSLELYPFKRVIAGGTGAVMVAHLHVPVLDSTSGIPATLSEKTVSGLLRTELNFKGLVITDALNMLGLAKYFSPGEAAVKAFKAGNDMLEMSTDLPAAIKATRKALRQHVLSRDDMEKKCRKVLAFKQWAGLDHYRPVDTTFLIKDLQQAASTALVQRLSDSSLTLLKGSASRLRAYLKGGSSAFVSLGAKKKTLVMDSMSSSYSLPVYSIGKKSTQQQIDSLKVLLKPYAGLVICIHDQRLRPQAKLDYSPELIHWISDLTSSPENVFIFLSNAYTVDKIPGIQKAKSVLLGYQDSPASERSVMHFFSGKIPANGLLPVKLTSFSTLR